MHIIACGGQTETVFEIEGNQNTTPSIGFEQMDYG